MSLPLWRLLHVNLLSCFLSRNWSTCSPLYPFIWQVAMATYPRECHQTAVICYIDGAGSTVLPSTQRPVESTTQRLVDSTTRQANDSSTGPGNLLLVAPEAGLWRVLFLFLYCLFFIHRHLLIYFSLIFILLLCMCSTFILLTLSFFPCRFQVGPRQTPKAGLAYIFFRCP